MYLSNVSSPFKNFMALITIYLNTEKERWESDPRKSAESDVDL